MVQLFDGGDILRFSMLDVDVEASLSTVRKWPPAAVSENVGKPTVEKK